MKRTTSEARTPPACCDRPAEPESTGPRMLPIVRIRGRLYFQDDRLAEFRRIDDIHDRITFEEMAMIVAILGKWPD